jgi:hypothetical protein
MAKLPGFADNAPRTLKALMKKDPNVAQYISSQIDQTETSNV